MNQKKIELPIASYGSFEILCESKHAEISLNISNEIILTEYSQYSYRWNIPTGFTIIWSDHPIIKSSRFDSIFGSIETSHYTGLIILQAKLQQKNQEHVIQLRIHIQPLKISIQQQQWMLRDLADFQLNSIINWNSPILVDAKTINTNQSSSLIIFSILRKWYRSGELQQCIESILRNLYQVSDYQFLNSSRLLINSNQWLNIPSRWCRIPSEHPLSTRIRCLPDQIHSLSNVNSYNNDLNQCTLGIIQYLLKSIKQIEKILPDEANLIVRELQKLSTHPIFLKIPSRINWQIQSSQIQKDGYQELFRLWKFVSQVNLDFTDSHKIQIEKRPQEQLYELWLWACFFKGLKQHLGKPIQSTNNFPRRGAYFDWITKKFRIRLCYNRSFSSRSDTGSWSTTLRPDMTLSYWPCELSYEIALDQGKIRHLHFDAKYRISEFGEVLNEDIHKMHTYRDAIHNSLGAYVIYPNNPDQSIEPVLFQSHGCKTGVGAFPISPIESCTINPIDPILNFLNELEII